jgi:hypothetical protein
MSETSKVVVELEVNEWSSDGLMALLRAMAYCYHAGASRNLEYYCDGDGNSPRVVSVTVDGREVPVNQLPGSEPKWREMVR